MQIEDIQPGLLDKTPMSNIYVDNTFSDKYLDVANFSNTSHLKLPTLQYIIGTLDNRPEAKPDFYSNIFQKSIENLKKKDETFLNSKYEVGSLNPNDVLPYVHQDTNYSNKLSAAFGQAAKGASLGAIGTASVSAIATTPIGGIGAAPGYVVGGIGGGIVGFLSGLLGETGKQGFNIGFNNRELTAQIQSGFGNRLSGFTNHIIDRSFEAGLGGTAALLATPFGALTGKDMYDWGSNPLSARLSKGLDESEYSAKLSDNYLSKGPIAKLFTGEGFQNEMADMIGFTVGMMVGTKGLGLLNKGAGLLASPLIEATGAEQTALRMANGDGLLGQVLPTLAKRSSAYFTKGAKLASETNFFKDGTNTLNALSAFERTALASYGEARVEASSSYKDIYNTAIKQGYSANEAANMATDGANRTLGMNMILLGITNQFGLNNVFKPRNVLPSLAKWLTKDYVFDNSTKLALKNILQSSIKNASEGFIMEGFVEELGQHTTSEYNKKIALDTNNQVYKSFLQEFINTYKESITSDEGISNWFGGGLFGAITGILGLDGGIIGAYQERNQAKNISVPLSLQTKMTKTNESIINIMDHTSAFNGQLYNSYNRDEQGNLIPNNQGVERYIKDPSTIIQLAKALESISTLTRDQVSSIVDATSLNELIKNSSEKDRKVLEDGFKGINSYLEHIDSLKEDKTGVAQGFIEFVDKLTTQQRNNVMTTLHALETAPLSEKAKSVQDIMKQQLLSNYVYDHVSNGVEEKLFDELDLIEKTLQNPNANIQDLEFLGKKYNQGEQGQALEDLQKQKKDIEEQVNIYRNLQLRFGQPLSYEYLRDKDGNIQKHAITVPLKKVFRSAIRQKQIQKSIKDIKQELDKLQGSVIEQYGDDAIIKELDKGLNGDLSNMKITEKLLESDVIDKKTKNKLSQYYSTNQFLDLLLKQENKEFNNLIDAKKIITKLHNDFKNLQDLIDEDKKKKESEEKLILQQQKEDEKKAKDQADFEEQQRKDAENGTKTEAELEKERLDRENQTKNAEALKQKQILIKSFNDKIVDGSLKVVDIKNGNILTVIFQNGVTTDMTVDEFNKRLEISEKEEESFMNTVLDRESDDSFLPELTEKNFKSTIGLDFRDGKYESKGTAHEKAMTNFYELVQDQFVEEGKVDEKYYLQPISGKTVDKTKPIYTIWSSGGFIPKDNDVILLLMDKTTNKPVEHNGSFAYTNLPIYSEFQGKNDNDIVEALLNKTESGFRRYRFPFINAVLEGNVENLSEKDREFAIKNTLLTEYVPIVKAGLKEREDFIKILNDDNVDNKSLKLPIVGYREGVLTKIPRTNLNELQNVNQDNLKIEPATKSGKAKILYNDKLVNADRNFLKDEDLDFIVNQLVKYGQLEEKTKESTKNIREELEKLIYIKTLKTNENFLELNKNAISLDGDILYRGGQTFGIDLTKATSTDIKNYLSFNGTFNLPYHVKNTLFAEESVNIAGKEYKSYEQFLKEKVFSVNYDITNDVIISKQANFIYPNTVTPKTNSKSETNNTVKVTLESIVDNLLNLPNLSMRGKFTQNDSEVLFKILNKAKNVTDLQLLERALLINYLIGLNVITDQIGPDRIPIVNSYLNSLQEPVSQGEVILPQIEEIQPTETIQEVTDKDKNDLFARNRKNKKSYRKTTKLERDNYIKENIEDFKNWLQRVLPQFPVETSKDVIDGVAEGMFYKNVITLYENAETGTGFHEAFEAVWNSLLTKEQRDDLRNEFKSREGTFKYPFSNEILAYSQATDAQAKETMAEEFRAFMLNKQLSSKQPLKNNFFLRLWNYIKDLFNMLSPFQRQDISKLDNLFNEINQGNLSLLKPTALYGEKEYRLIKEDEQFVISNYILSATKSKLFEVFSDITNTKDVLLLNKENNDILNIKLEEIRQFFENQIQTDPVLKQIQKDYFSKEGFKKYTLPHLKQHINTFGIETILEETDEDNRGKENFIESMYIDSKTLVGSAIKTLVHTLSNKEYNGSSYENVYGDYDFFGEYNTFVDGHKVINILQNTLSNTPSRVFINGKVYNAIDLMFEKLDAFQSNGVYKKGYEWIPELKERVNKNHSLRMAFEKSFCTTRVQNTKVLLKESNGLENIIVELDPVQDETITNIRYKYIDGFREKYNIDNELEKTVVLPIIKEGSLQQEFNQLLDFLGISKNEFDKAKEKNESLYNTYLSNILIGYDKFKTTNKEGIIQVSKIEDFLTSFEGIGSSFKNLMILNTNQDEKQLVYKNADGKKQYGIFNNTTWSQFINVVNLVKTKQDLLNTLPHLANNTRTDFKDSFKHSVVLNNLFDKNGNRTSHKFNYTLINGVDIDKDNGMVTANLNDIDRTIQRVFYLRKGIHYTMVNSDKSSEFAINLGPLLGNHTDKDFTQFTEYLWNTYAKPQLEFYNSYLSNQKTKYEYFTKSLNNGDLGFFGKVKLDDNGLIDIENSKLSISKHILGNISKMVNDLSILSEEINLLNYFYEGDVSPITKQKFEKEIVYNTLLSTLEQHLFIYGDPMFYKIKDGILDSPKRTSAYNANKEQVLLSQEHWNEQYKQTVRLVPKENDGKFGVATFDDIEVMFQKDKLNHLLLDAYESIKQTYPTDITDETISKMLGVDFTFNNGIFTVTNYKSEGLVKAYLEMNEADAQAYILTDFYMDLMYRSAKLKPEQIDTLNWKKAKEIEIRSSLNNKNPLYKKFTKDQIKWAKDIIKKLGEDPGAVLTTLKPQYSGYSENNTMLVPSLLKNSVFPLHFIDLYDENTKTILFPKAMDVYIKAQNNNVDIVGHRSGQKFGATLDQEGQFTSLFKDGNITDEYPVVQTMYETFMGIQSEIPAKRKFEILSGSQITKIITQNLNELAKIDPELAQTLKDYTENINARKDLGLKELEEKFGLISDGDTYKIDNPSKIVDQIRKELNRLNLPDNVKDIIELNSEQNNVKYKFEASPNNLSLQSVLLSMVDKSLVHQKIRGKGSVQIAGSLFSNETRTTEKAIINGKEKEIATSSDLEFYYDKNGRVTGMEVLIPNPFYDIYPDLTWEQFKVMADKNPKLYQLCGYRIPTQSMGQFEYITIKGFYNNSLGDSIIVPSGIVAKAGSDFDIDKLFLYIPHVKLNKDNELEYIEYLDDSNSTVEDRYKKYGLTKVYDEYSTTLNSWFNQIKNSNKSLQEAYDNLQEIKKENSLTRETFNTLPISYKEAFWNRNAELDEYNVKGIAKIMDFRDLANRYITLLEEEKDLESLPIIDKLSTMIVEYDRYLNIDKSIYEDFNKMRDVYIEDRDFFMENKDYVLSSAMLDKGFISKEEFEQLSIPAQNSKKALENRNIELMNKLASHKANTYTSMIPNNADTLKSLSPRKGTDTYMSIASFTRQNDFRQANLTSKSLVGMAAVHVTGHCITQNGQTKLTGTFVNRLGKKENINIILPVPYSEFLAFDHIWDTNGSLISANLSEFLSAIVDAAKDPFIFDLNINEETLNVALYLTRLGVSLKDTIYFLSTPIIKRYLKNKQIESGLFKKGVFKKYIKSQNLILIESIHETRLNKIGSLSKDKSINSDMFYKIGMFGVITNPETGYPVINYDVFEEKLQYLYNTVSSMITKDSIDLHDKNEIISTYVLLSYLKYNEQSGYLSNINRAISIDTKSPNTISTTVDLQNQKEKIKEDSFVSNPEDIFNNTFLGNLWNNKEKGLEQLSNYQLMANKTFIDNYLTPALNIINRDKFVSTETKTKLINKFQNFLITYHLQNYEFETGTINSRKASIKESVIKNYNKILNQNPEFLIFKLLTKNKVKDNELENIVKLRSTVQTSDINKSIEEMLEFIQLYENSDNIDEKQESINVKEFLKSLTDYSIVQSGFGPSNISFANYLPLQTYTDYLNSAFVDLYENIESKVIEAPIAQLWKQFVQNNSTNKNLVDQITEEWAESGPYLTKGYKGYPGLLEKTYNLTDTVPLYVNVTYDDPQFGTKQILNQIKTFEQVGLKLQVTYSMIPTLGRGKYFTETVPVELTDKDEVLINIINSNKLDNIANFESEMQERDFMDMTKDEILEDYSQSTGETIGTYQIDYPGITYIFRSLDTLITDFDVNTQELFAAPTVEKYKEVVGNYEFDLSAEISDEEKEEIQQKLNDVKKSFILKEDKETQPLDIVDFNGSAIGMQENSTSVANIPQNKVSGVSSYGSLVTANDNVINILGPNPHSIDMIEAGLRTRTTRSESEMAKYSVKVGDIIKHFGKSADGTTKNILARIVAIHPKSTEGWRSTWEKEGWKAEDVDVIDKFKDGAAAIEFELLDKKPTENTNQQETQIDYTPKGKAIQTYTIKGSKIFNKEGKEVFTTDSIDRNKIFANLAIQQGRAVIVDFNGTDYVVNNKDQIISTTTGKIMQWDESNGNRKNILYSAHVKFNKLTSTTQIPRKDNEGNNNECLK